MIKPVMGNLSDRWGRRTIILPGLLLGTISVGMLPLGQSVLTLCLLSLLFGIGFATVTSSTSALVADLTQNGQYGASLGVLRTVMDVGQTIGPVLTGFVVGAWGYSVAFPALAAVLALSALIFVFPSQRATDK